jgi:hypothetical protein
MEDRSSRRMRTLVTAGFDVTSFVPDWRATADEDGHYCFAVALYASAEQAPPPDNLRWPAILRYAAGRSIP